MIIYIKKILSNLYEAAKYYLMEAQVQVNEKNNIQIKLFGN